MKQTQLSKATRDRIDRHHESSMKRALAAEKIANRLLEPTVRNATNELVSGVAMASTAGGTGGLRSAAMAGILRGTRRLQDEAGHAVVAARGHARKLAQGQVAEELGEAVVAAGHAFNVDAARLPQLPQLSLLPAVDTLTQDEAAGLLVGMRVANRWSSMALGYVTIWQRQGGGVDGLARHLRKASEDTEARTRAEGTTTAFDAYADEHRAAMVEALRRTPGALKDTALTVIPGGAGAGDEHFDYGLPLGWGQGLMDIWSAILDRKTCPRCMDVDGKMVPVGKEFPTFGRPPIHRCCRCITCTVFIPEAFSKRLPGLELDYASLKDDVRDYMKGSSLSLGVGKRHAESYVREVIPQRQGPVRSSPEILTRTMLGRDYFPDMPAKRARAPRVQP